jgi:hypothetical protein
MVESDSDDVGDYGGSSGGEDEKFSSAHDAEDALMVTCEV